jgi:hypothetical protein
MYSRRNEQYAFNPLSFGTLGITDSRLRIGKGHHVIDRLLPSHEVLL